MNRAKMTPEPTMFCTRNFTIKYSEPKIMVMQIKQIAVKIAN
jgi:hypothetical protein